LFPAKQNGVHGISGLIVPHHAVEENKQGCELVQSPTGAVVIQSRKGLATFKRVVSGIIKLKT